MRKWVFEGEVTGAILPEHTNIKIKSQHIRNFFYFAAKVCVMVKIFIKQIVYCMELTS